MSVKVGGGTFYNLEEQVQVNKDDISNIKAKDTTQDASITALEQFKTKCDGAFEIEDDASVSFGHDVYSDGGVESGTDVTVGRNLYIDDLTKLQDPNGNQIIKQATAAQIGLCRPDGSTIFIDGNGKLYTVGGGGGTQLYLHIISGAGPESGTSHYIITTSSTAISYNSMYCAFQIEGKLISSYLYYNGRFYGTNVIQDEGGGSTYIYASYFAYPSISGSSVTWTFKTAQATYTDTVTEI